MKLLHLLKSGKKPYWVLRSSTPGVPTRLGGSWNRSRGPSTETSHPNGFRVPLKKCTGPTDGELIRNHPMTPGLDRKTPRTQKDVCGPGLLVVKR